MPTFCNRCGHEHERGARCHKRTNFEALAGYWKDAYLNMAQLAMSVAGPVQSKRKTKKR